MRDVPAAATRRSLHEDSQQGDQQALQGAALRYG